MASSSSRIRLDLPPSPSLFDESSDSDEEGGIGQTSDVEDNVEVLSEE